MSHIWILATEIYALLTILLTILLSKWTELFSSWGRGNQDHLPKSLDSGHKNILTIEDINDVLGYYSSKDWCMGWGGCQRRKTFIN